MGWIEKSDFEVKIVIAGLHNHITMPLQGNHDITLDREFYAQHGHSFHNQCPEDPEECISLLSNSSSSSSVIYLNHQSATVSLTRPDGPRARLKVFGSPYSPETPGRWAFTYSRDGNIARDLWDAVPLDTDIVVTHTPPFRHCDEVPSGDVLGCEALRRTLWRVRPRLAVCGHVHQSRGCERIRWNLSCADATYGESGNIHKAPPPPPSGSKKQYLVDLSGRKGPKLDNDGSITAAHPQPDNRSERPLEGETRGEVTRPGTFLDPSIPAQLYDQAETTIDAPVTQTQGRDSRERGGQGDTEALLGRLGRKETCVVNASIMANSWPHKGGKRFNAPIVVDLDLPVWE
ncbi:hypothetical protein FQN54_008390 [Arachnomyces sp. PD_36]|nr:hypothetical protein FQN54_008390 [Arachnomyces sp. PD_36]